MIRIYPYLLAILLSLLTALLLVSCATQPVERFSGPLCLDIHIVPDRDNLLDWCVTQDAEACSREQNQKFDIWMVGERSVDKYVYVNEYYFGHEMRHLLHWRWPERFENPDKPGWFLGE